MPSEPIPTRPSTTDLWVQQNIRNPTELLLKAQDKVARSLEQRFNLPDGAITLAVHSNHYLSRELLEKTMRGEEPDIICGELGYDTTTRAILEPNREYISSDAKMQSIGYGGTADEKKEHDQVISEMYPATTFLSFDADWNFYSDASFESELVADKAGKLAFSATIAGLSSILVDQLGLINNLTTYHENDYIDGFRDFFDRKKISRRTFLKLGVTAIFLGSVSQAIGMVIPNFEKEVYLKQNEGVVHLRNIIMVQNFWNMLSDVKGTDPKILFFSGGAHAGILQLLREDPSFSEKAIEMYAELFIEKIYALVQENGFDPESDSPTSFHRSDSFAHYAKIFSQSSQIGDYNFKLGEKDAPPSPLTIFFRILKEHMSQAEETEQQFYHNVIQHLQHMLGQERPDLHPDPDFYKNMINDGQSAQFEILHIRPEFSSEISAIAGQGSLEHSQYGWENKYLYFAGIAVVGGKSYELQRDIFGQQSYVILSKYLRIVIPS